MAQNYARDLAIDKNGRPYTQPPYTSYQSQNGVPLASSVISLNPNTTVIQITVMGGQAGNAAVIGKWGVASVTATNFDWIVQSGQQVNLVVPSSIMGNGQQNVAASLFGLYPAVAVKTATGQSASIFSAEW